MAFPIAAAGLGVSVAGLFTSVIGGGKARQAKQEQAAWNRRIAQAQFEEQVRTYEYNIGQKKNQT